MDVNLITCWVHRWSVIFSMPCKSWQRGSSYGCPLLLVMSHNMLWWRFMGWNLNDYKAMRSTSESKKWQGSEWLMISWRCSCFYFFLICLYAGYGHFLHSISTTRACCWLGAFLVVLLILRRCFDGCRNKELMNKGGIAWRAGGGAQKICKKNKWCLVWLKRCG
jgi:hypothetical protein